MLPRSNERFTKRDLSEINYGKIRTPKNTLYEKKTGIWTIPCCHWKAENIKSSTLLTCIGQEAGEIYYTFTFTDPADSMKFGPILEKFTEYCNPQKTLPLFVISFFVMDRWKDSPSTNSQLLIRNAQLTVSSENCKTRWSEIALCAVLLMKERYLCETEWCIPAFANASRGLWEL